MRRIAALCNRTGCAYTAATGSDAASTNGTPASLYGRARCVFLRAFDHEFDAGQTGRTLTAAGATTRASSSAGPALSWTERWREIAGSLLSVLTPADCRVCDGPLLNAPLYGVCTACMTLLRPEHALLCSRCGERMDVEDGSGYGFSRGAPACCEACRTTPPPYVRAAAFASYDGTLRSLIRLHKFDGIAQLARPLGERLAPVLAQSVAAMPAGTVHVIAVPLHRRRRQYNQSAHIADAALRHLRAHGAGQGLKVRHDALVRVRATETQSHLSPAQRRENVRGAFAVGTDVRGWQVVLVDDVYTTGATVRECARTLLRAGAAAVNVVTLARTQPERVALWLPAGTERLIEHD